MLLLTYQPKRCGPAIRHHQPAVCHRRNIQTYATAIEGSRAGSLRHLILTRATVALLRRAGRVACALVLLVACLPALDSEAVDLGRKDHQLHFAAGAIAALAAEGAGRWIGLRPWQRAVLDVGAAGLLGVAKELADQRRPDRNCSTTGDAMATALGGVPVALMFSVRF